MKLIMRIKIQIVTLFVTSFVFLHSEAQTCSSGSAVSSTGYGFVAWGGSAHAQNATGAILAAGSALTPGNAALLQDDQPLIIDMQRLVSGGSTFTISVQRMSGSANSSANLAYSTNGTTWSTSGSGTSATGWNTGAISTNNSTSQHITKTVPTGGFRYVRITSTNGSTNPLLIDGVWATHYCPQAVSVSNVVRSFYNPGTFKGSLATNVYPANAQSLVYSFVTSASSGTWTITNSATGDFTYTPSSSSFDGIDIGIFRVCDGSNCYDDTILMKAIFNCETNLFYAPIPENQTLDYLQDIDLRTSGSRNNVPLNVYMGLSVTSDAIVMYDHWEDGFESNLSSPTQSTTQIWGDADLKNGIAPGTTDDILSAGKTMILQNLVLAVTTAGLNIVDYDGRDKIFVYGKGAMSKLGWGTALTVSVSGASVPSTNYWGNNYTIPTGQTTSGVGSMFEITSASIMAATNSTTVNIDIDGPGGTAAYSVTLNAGESYYLDSRTSSGLVDFTSGTTLKRNVLQGATITANNPIQVMYMTGTQGTNPGSDLYGGRTFSLIPDAQLSTCYTLPAVYGLSRRVFLYNNSGSTITITRTAPGGTTTTFTIAANSSVNQSWTAGSSSDGYQYCSGSSAFSMIACVDDNDIISDWGFIPTASANLQQMVLMSLGFGQDPTQTTTPTRNYEQLLVTPTSNTYFYVDFNGDNIPDKFCIGQGNLNTTQTAVAIGSGTYNENTSNNGVLVSAYNTLSISDPDGDMSGAVIWTKTGANNAGNYGGVFAAIWGQNDGSAQASPNIDAGYTVPPKVNPPMNTQVRIRFPEVCPGSTTDTIHITPKGGVSPYRIQWINLTTGKASVYNFNDSTDIVGLTPGKYQIKIRDNNCLIYTQDVVITEKTTGCGVALSGNVYNDTNGLNNSLIDGTSINSPATTQLYAYIDSAGIIKRKLAVPANGFFSFAGLATSTTYSVIISTTNVNVGSTTPSATLPNNWVYTGEQFGLNNSAGTGIQSGTANGIITVTTGTTNVSLVNFGIEERPVATNVTATSQKNPGGTNTVKVVTLAGTDLEDGSLGSSDTLVISTLPVNAKLYYNGVMVTAGQIIPNYNPALLTVDPSFNGADTVKFTFTWKDAAGFTDLTPATAIMPFEGLTIAGNVLHDNDGNTDLNVDGPGIGSPVGSQLWAYLIENGTVVDSSMVASNGKFSFDVANANSTYNVRISTTRTAVGTSAPAVVLPTNWVSTGEEYGTNNSSGSGLESGTANSVIAVSTTTNSITSVDFGIEYATYAHDKIYTINPDSIYLTTGAPATGFSHYLILNKVSGSSDTSVNSSNSTIMPGLLSGYDLEDGRYNGLSGTSTGILVFSNLPDTSNALLQYNGIKLWPTPSSSDPSWIYWNTTTNRYEIPAFDADKLIMLFKMAYQNSTSFNYGYIDSAGMLGRMGTYELNFTVPLPISLSDLSCFTGQNGIELQWSSFQNSEIKDMYVMRSTDGLKFNRIAEINNIDYSTETQHFRYLDKLSEASFMAYRIDATDLNGHVVSTNVCVSRFNTNVEVVKLSAMPNPTNDNVNILIQTPVEQTFGITVVDATGRVLEKLNKQITSIENVNLQLSTYEPGIYNVVVSWEGKSEVIRIVRL